MKKIFLILSVFLLFCAYAIEEFKEVGIAKYAVLEVIDDYSPLREKPDENAKRITHLPKGAVLFSSAESENYFLVELNEENKFYINKKFIEVQAIIPEKRFDGIDEIVFREKKDRYIVDYKALSFAPFIVSQDGSNLKISFYDVHFDPTNAKIENKLSNFEVTDKISNEFEIKYKNSEPNKPLFGYDVQKTEDGYKIIIKKAPQVNKVKPLKGRKILVDAGHGGAEYGACAFGLQEKKINLQISKKLRKELKKRGAQVYMTRSNDKIVPLYDRVNLAKEKDIDISLSIHQNSLADRSKVEIKHGVGTYYYDSQAKPLAQSIQKQLLQDTSLKDDKVNYASFAMTRMTLPVSVLIECAYLICEKEAQLLSNKKFQKIIARAIAKGTVQYLKENF